MLKLVRTHRGDYPATGGNYGFYEIIKKGDGGLVRLYKSTADPLWIFYCDKLGEFQQDCLTCRYWQGKRCRKPYEKVGKAFFNSLAKKIKIKAIFLIEMALEEEKIYELDLTGHKPVRCKEGGCRLCYPCGHPPDRKEG